jgi:hypothetical protein
MRTGHRVLIAAAFVALFLATRLVNLMLLPVFVDEALHVDLAQVVSETGELVGSDSGKYLPLWLLAPVVGRAADPLRAARLCSVAYGLLAALGVFLLGREIHGERAGLLAAAFYLVAPWTLFFDRIALVDTLLSVLVLYSLIVAIRWASSASRSWAAVLGLLIGLAGLTKLYGLLLLLLPASLALLWPNASRSRLAGQALLSYAIAFAIVWPLAGGLEMHLSYAAERLRFMREGDALFPGLETPASVAEESIQYLTLPGAALALFGIAGAIAVRRPRDLLLFGTWACWFLLFTVAGDRWSPRYLLPGTVPLLALGAAAVLRLADTAGAWRSWAAVALPVALFGLLVCASWRLDAALLTDPSQAPLPSHDRTEYVEGMSAGYGIAEVADFLRARAAGREVVVLRDARSGPLLEGLDLELARKPARIRFVTTYYREGDDLPTAEDVMAEPETAYVLRQRPTTPPALIDLGGGCVLNPVAIIPKPGKLWQMEVYRVGNSPALELNPSAGRELNRSTARESTGSTVPPSNSSTAQ